MDTCITCRWCKIESVDPNLAGVGNYICKKAYRIHPIYGDKAYTDCNIIRGEKSHCPLWEQGGLKGWFKRIFS